MKRTLIKSLMSAASVLLLMSPPAIAQTDMAQGSGTVVSDDDVGPDGLKRRGDGSIDDNSNDSTDHDIGPYRREAGNYCHDEH